MFCKHEWNTVAEQVLQSAFEQMGAVTEVKRVCSWVFEKKHIVILNCNKCGKIKEIVNKNPE